MHPAMRWWEKFYLLNFLVAGRKVSHVFLPSLTASKWSVRSTSRGQSSLTNEYSEEAFQFLVQNEAKRSERSGRVSRIILIYRADAQGTIVSMGQHISKAVIAVLSNSIRETDYIGWYRDEQIIGALLTTSGPDFGADGGNGLRTRIATLLRTTLLPEQFRSLEVRLWRHDEITDIKLI